MNNIVELIFNYFQRKNDMIYSTQTFIIGNIFLFYLSNYKLRDIKRVKIKKRRKKRRPFDKGKGKKESSSSRFYIGQPLLLRH